MHTPYVLVNVRGLLAAEGAIGTLVPGRFAALVPEVAEHGVAPAVTVVALGTVELAGVQVVLRVLRVLLHLHGVKLGVPATYKRSCHGQHTIGRTAGRGRDERLENASILLEKGARRDNHAERRIGIVDGGRRE